jgi:hypothetical protein
MKKRTRTGIIITGLVALVATLGFGYTSVSAAECNLSDITVKWTDKPSPTNAFSFSINRKTRLIIKGPPACNDIKGTLKVFSIGEPNRNTSEKKVIDVTQDGIPFTLGSESGTGPVSANVEFQINDEDCYNLAREDFEDFDNPSSFWTQARKDQFINLLKDGYTVPAEIKLNPRLGRTYRYDEANNKLAITTGEGNTISVDLGNNSIAVVMSRYMNESDNEQASSSGGTLAKALFRELEIFDCGYVPGVSFEGQLYDNQSGQIVNNSNGVEYFEAALQSFMGYFSATSAFSNYRLFTDSTAVLAYYCNGACDNKWSISSPAEVGSGEAARNTSSACYDPTTGEYKPDCYELLAPLPGLGRKISFNDDDFSLGKYFSVMIRIAMGVASLAAVLFITYAGIQYMIAGNSGGGIKLAEAKARITNALIGIGVIAVSWIILNTINPELLNINPVFRRVALQGESGIDTYFDKGGVIPNIKGAKRDKGTVPSNERQTMVRATNTSSFIALRSRGVTVSDGQDLIHPALGAKLVAFNTELKSLGFAPVVTEAFAPTFYGHVSKCHYTGTCIDLNFDTKDENNPARVKQIIELALKHKLLPVFEVTDNSQALPYANAGIVKPYLAVVKHATGKHFSIYDIVE